MSNLKAYGRYDSQNRIVASSVVFRTKKPSGNFREVPGYNCCNDLQTPTIVTLSGTLPIEQPGFRLGCMGAASNPVLTAGGSPVTVNTILEITNQLNIDFSYLGSFTQDGINVFFTPNAAIAKTYQKAGATSLIPSTT